MSDRGRGRRLACGGLAALLLATSCVAVAQVRGIATTDCRNAKVWITHKLASGSFASTWLVPDCGRHQASGIAITIDPSKRQQQMLGFGAALTGGAAWLMAERMHPAQRARVLHELFAPPPEGIGLSLLRLPIGSSDLSRRRYSLAPLPPDRIGGKLTLDLAPIRNTVLPVLREIMKIQPGLRIVASPWSPPAWMKTSRSMVGGNLRPEYEADFARYLADFVAAMQRNGVPIFALAIQNEPDYLPGNYPGMWMSEKQRARVIANDVGPLFAREHLQTKILGLDGNWDRVPQVMALLADRRAARFVAGIAWHCYVGEPDAQDRLHQRHPEKWQLLTECSDGDWPPNDTNDIADFASSTLINPARHWGAGSILWGLALDTQHGPHDGGCGECVGVVTIDRHTGRAKPTRDYYALAHFSAFVAPGDYRVASTGTVDGLDNVSFIDPRTGKLTIVLANTRARSQRVRIDAGEYHLAFSVPGNSVATAEVSRGVR